MSETARNRHHLHFSELPASLRLVYTGALLLLGLGYLFALIYVFHTYSGKDGNPGDLSYEDMVIAYSGSGKGSRLESALGGAMSPMLPADENRVLVAWVQSGAEKTPYETAVRPLIEKRCMTCHDGSNPHLANLGGYENMQKVAERDTGANVFTLVRVSHIHLFGLTFVFFLVGTIFSHAHVRPAWLKSVVVFLPFVCLTLDIGSWYFTKLFHPFAALTMAAGGVMGLSFAFMWVVSMWQMWIGKPPADAAARGLP